jgi:hypothetical protein
MARHWPDEVLGEGDDGGGQGPTLLPVGLIAMVEQPEKVGVGGEHALVEGRGALRLPLRGSTPDLQLMAIGDVEVDGLGRDAWHQWFGETGAIMLCPLPGTASFQVQASPELDDDGAPLERP